MTSSQDKQGYFPSKSIHLAEITMKLSQEKQLRLVCYEVNENLEITLVTQHATLWYLWLLKPSGRFHLIKWDNSEETSRISGFVGQLGGSVS